MATCLTNVLEIEREECIGNSRTTINDNFHNLKNEICSKNADTLTIRDQLVYLIPYGGIINFKGDITLGGLNFDFSGAGKLNPITKRDLTCYALCNGNNGTPDLRDRFVVAAGASYVTGDMGPRFNSTASLQFSSVQLTIPEMAKHNHSITDPGHVHTITDNKHLHTYTDENDPDKDMYVFQGLYIVTKRTTFAAPDGNKQHITTTDKTDITVDPTTVDITINPTGGNQRHENRPPYMALGYIMRYKA